MADVHDSAMILPSPDFRVLLVDDEPDFARGMARLLAGRFPEIKVEPVHSGAAALNALELHSVQLMVTDLRMPEMNGMQLLKEALRRHTDLSIVVLSAYGSIETAVEALRAGAYDFLTKPIETDQLFRVVEKGLERSRLLAENIRLRQILSQQDAQFELVGQSSAMQHLRSSIAAVAQADYTVLIRGESGTGKELAAHLIHRLGTRTGKPFLAVNCPSIPENLLESELFGYVRGAFTGAHQDHKGLISAADTGTIHLDEIGDIRPNVQTKLLRFLQDGEVRQVGAHVVNRVNVRILASTNQNLEARMQDNNFREDLYYRLNVLSLTLPPLRERIEDIPLLAHYFLRRTCREMGIAEKEISPEVLQWMSSLPWPGNVRELQNLIRRLTVFSSSERIDLPLVHMVMTNGSPPQSSSADKTPSGQPLVPYKEAKTEVVDAFTRRYLQQLLPLTKGNISEAARLSGLSRVALQKILLRLGEQAASFR
ncbi:MAG: sigma-54 dependent transcriptional regulator [Desulfobulbus sp.]|nr:sigma-54 dependent transcriptional regulator [Desulfobulbus sp.]